jgi:hypothetical protein
MFNEELARGVYAKCESNCIILRVILSHSILSHSILRHIILRHSIGSHSILRQRQLKLFIQNSNTAAALTIGCRRDVAPHIRERSTSRVRRIHLGVEGQVSRVSRVVEGPRCFLCSKKRSIQRSLRIRAQHRGIVVGVAADLLIGGVRRGAAPTTPTALLLLHALGLVDVGVVLRIIIVPTTRGRYDLRELLGACHVVHVVAVIYGRCVFIHDSDI